MRLKPDEAYSYSLSLLDDLIVSEIRLENELFDRDMQMLAWQTSLIMNSSGNYKKSLKPTDLYTSLDETEQKPKGAVQEISESKKKELQDELLERFRHSDVIIK